MSWQSRMVGNKLHWGKPTVLQQWEKKWRDAVMIEPPINPELSLASQDIHWRNVYIFRVVARYLDTHSIQVIRTFPNGAINTPTYFGCCLAPPKKTGAATFKTEKKTEKHQTLVKTPTHLRALGGETAIITTREPTTLPTHSNMRITVKEQMCAPCFCVWCLLVCAFWNKKIWHD